MSTSAPTAVSTVATVSTPTDWATDQWGASSDSTARSSPRRVLNA